MTDMMAVVQRRSRRSTTVAILLSAAALLAGCGGSAEADFAGSRREPAPAVDSVSLPAVSPDGAATPFEFRADDGNVLLVYFGYTSCPDVCPTTMSDISASQAQLGDDGDRVQLAMATIDPERDTPEVLSAYVNGFVDGGVALRTEDEVQLQEAADLFGVFYEVGTSDEGVVEVLHTGTLFGVDDSGTLVASWAFGTPQSDLLNDLEILLKDA